MNTKVVTKKRRVERQTSESRSIRLLRVVHERRREKERARVGCSGNGGREWMGVSAAESDLINVVVAWENTQLRTLLDTQCVSILRTTVLLGFHGGDEVDLDSCPLDEWNHFRSSRKLMNFNPSHWPARGSFLIFNGPARQRLQRLSWIAVHWITPILFYLCVRIMPH